LLVQIRRATVYSPFIRPCLAVSFGRHGVTDAAAKVGGRKDVASHRASHQGGVSIMHTQRAIRGLLTQPIVSCVLMALSVGISHADWTQTAGPRGGSIRSFVAVPNASGGTSLYAGQIKVWRTDDNGASWARLDNGLNDPNAPALLAVPNGSGGNDILVGTNSGIFRSTDEGGSWNAINSGLTNLSIYALASGPNGSGGTNLYAGAFMGDVFRSIDNGANWTAIQTGLPLGYNVNALTTTASGTILAGTMNGIYRSTNFGASWTRVFTLYGFAFAGNGSSLYAGTSNGVYRSTDDGATWNAINNGLGFVWIRAIAAIQGATGVALFAGAGGVLRSTDNGATWTPVNNGLTSLSINALTTAPGAGGGMDLYAGTGEGIFRSTDNGGHWTNVSFVYSGVQGLEVTPNGTVLAATENDIFRSVNGGGTWTDTQANTTALDFAVNLHGTQGVSLFAGGSPAGILKSTDDGATWVASSNALDDFDVNSMAAVPNGAGGSNILAGTYSQLFISTNDGGSWQPAGLLTLTLDYTVTPNGAGGHNIFAGGFGGVWLSTTYGTGWTQVNAGLEDKIVQGLASTAGGANLFAGGDPFGVVRSTNNGATWTPVNNGLSDLRITTLLSPDGTNLFAGGGGGVYVSKDDGNSWTSVGTGLTTGVFSLALSADGTTLLAGTTGLGVWTRPTSEMIGGTVAVPDPTVIAPEIALGANHPNPFQSQTTILYSLPRPMGVRLAIYDVTGRAVRTLVDGVQGAGDQHVAWDGRDERGILSPSGVYVCRLEAAGTSRTHKVSLLR
jgi:photosystem II stability/assembly factor-like uncharacterized protein